MKWSPILHLLTIVAVIAGSLALLGAWFATWRGGSLAGLTVEHLFNDAQTLILLAIALALGVLIHHQKEQGL